MVISSESGEWNYGSMGPDEWFEQYPQCAGILQSPINIVSSSAVYNSKLSDILFINYDKILYWNATNNGHTSTFQLIKLIFSDFLTELNIN